MNAGGTDAAPTIAGLVHIDRRTRHCDRRTDDQRGGDGHDGDREADDRLVGLAPCAFLLRSFSRRQKNPATTRDARSAGWRQPCAGAKSNISGRILKMQIPIEDVARQARNPARQEGGGCV
jgi:hypothetical protein